MFHHNQVPTVCISAFGEHVDDYRISGSIFALRVNEVPDSLTDLLLDQIETYGHVTVQFAGMLQQGTMGSVLTL
ncbi:hypothetical protein DPMN_032404 [Dreissena polymorpha]|uniref:Uncharacterized protein n=1 Tax=Dreissena polymorpha TaxID=45954 RepID=A0A9D4M445_DREPO|nr:hypothetical protein DPMN_032404 [Dreissena polymorpha]